MTVKEFEESRSANREWKTYYITYEVKNGDKIVSYGYKVIEVKKPRGRTEGVILIQDFIREIRLENNIVDYDIFITNISMLN